mmetsp:Transcript_35864/g.83112  ORF Transcript_35864/g.83112 Transcript_35864/m.83112 type:complete len:311 (-) Transcript_35864:240-1172(-)
MIKSEDFGDPVLADFLKRTLAKHPNERPEASELLGHPFFQTQILTDAVKAKEEADALVNRNQRDCAVCSDTFDIGQGVECEGNNTKHFTCNECFTGYVRSRVDNDAFRMFAAKGGAIPCPGYQCPAPSIKPQVLSQHVSEEVFGEYSAALKKMEEQKINATLEKDFADRLSKAEKQWAELSEAERRRRVHRNHICERILTLSCPRCGQAFVDFEGCFALTCSRDNAAFCAYCLEDCGSNAHPHVKICRHNPNRGRSGNDVYYNDRGAFEAAQSERRVRMLWDYLGKLVPKEREDALEDCRQDLNDLGLPF